MGQQTQRQALLGFVPVFDPVEDLASRISGTELGIALDIGDDVEDLFNRPRNGAALADGLPWALGTLVG